MAEARESVVDALMASGMAWTVLRPTGFFNDMRDIFQMAVKGTGWLVGDGHFSMNPIDGADLAAEVVRCMGEPSARGRAFDVGGPDVMTYREMLELAFAALGRAPKLRSAPLWTVSAVASVVRLWNPFVADLIRAIRYMAEWETVAPCHGTHHLADFYRELAASARS